MDMGQTAKLQQYSAQQINDVMDELRGSYDIVRLVNVDECRVVDVQQDGTINYLHECFRTWGRSSRCENCSSYRACKTNCPVDKREFLGNDVEDVHSLPVEVMLKDGEEQAFVVECVRKTGHDEAAAAAAAEHSKDRSLDVLTNLYTAEMLHRVIRRRLIESPDVHFILMVCNIRNFSLLNQLFGVEGGNRLLVGLADALRDVCASDTIYGRYRDDRFVMLAPSETTLPVDLVTRLQERVDSLSDGTIFDIFVKLGVYEVDDYGLPVSAMVEHAELAVDSIRDNMELPLAWYVPKLLERKLWDQQVISDFERALQAGEYQIYLQPQVNAEGRILGAEALVRWIRSGEVLLPGSFLPVLSHSELLCHLDEAVWEQAAALLGRWQGTDLGNYTISVNVDPTDFLYVDVPHKLRSLCERYGAPHDLLRVEITEAALLEDTERQSHMVDVLHAEGFLVEIDDFGRGASSLSMLKDIRADILKIDMGFLQDSRNADRSKIILESVIEMADHLSMDVITEGVETKEQVEMVAGFGCPVFQGFYFSRPIPVSDFVTLVRSQLR